MRSKITVLLLTMSAVAAAQNSSGYVFFAPGGVTASGHTEATFHTGGGFDAHLAKGVALNMELGILYPKKYFSEAVSGVFSPGGAYYFRHGKDLRLEPFIDGGYSLIFRNGHGNLWYCGGGVNYWLTQHVGLRFEVRDHIYPHSPTVHFWGLRAAVAFR